MSIPRPSSLPARSRLSRALSALDRATSRPRVGIIAIFVDALWILSSVALGFPPC